MTTTVVGILIVVLWLFVLMPFLLRKHKPISKVGEGFDDTRVIHEGGHKPQRPPALRPKVAAADAQQRKLIADQPEFGVEDTPTVPFKKITSPLISDKPKSANDTVAMAAASNRQPVAKDSTKGSKIGAQAQTHVPAKSKTGTDASRTSATSGTSSAGQPARTATTQAKSEHTVADQAKADHDKVAAARAKAAARSKAAAGADTTAKAKAAKAKAESDANADATTETMRAAAAVSAPAVSVPVASVHAANTSAKVGSKPVDPDTPYEIDDSYLDPEDLLYPTGARGANLSVVPDVPTKKEKKEKKSAAKRSVAKRTAADIDDNISDSDELTPEEIEFAKSRRGRGGYDPEADKKHSADRYQRRRSTVLGLVVAVVVTIVPAGLIGGWMWAAPAIALGMTIIYLIALRAQVRDEERLRHKRVHQLRRTRAGVRNSMDRELGIPHRLRRPGAVVLETDDDSPDFIGLELVETNRSAGESEPEPEPAVQYDNVIKLRVG